jgi:phosphoglycolate phosphatase-like HAD superfamily hydrolase
MDYSFTPLFSSIETLTKERPELRPKVYGILDEEERLAVKAMVPQPNVKGVLQFLKEKGFDLGLVTLQGKNTALMALKVMNIQNFFNTIITRESSLNRKEQLKMALRALHAKNAVVIGDRVEDVDAGKQLGCLVIGISKSSRRRRRLRDSEPRGVISSLSELPAILENLTC